jgi:enoyl-CoA hydratase/carnithine racemase
VLPLNVAMRVALTGRHERLGAQRAYELGLVSEVVAHDSLLERAREVAAIVNRNAPLAVRGTRLAIRKGLDLPLHEAEILAEAFRERVLRTDDAQEGPRRFVEKRAAAVEVRDDRRYSTIRYETAPDRVATITLDRPDALNAFDRTMCEEIRSRWQRIKAIPR